MCFKTGSALCGVGNQLVIAGEKTGFIERSAKPAAKRLEFTSNGSVVDRRAGQRFAERSTSAATGNDKQLLPTANDSLSLAGDAITSSECNGRAKRQ